MVPVPNIPKWKVNCSSNMRSQPRHAARHLEIDSFRATNNASERPNLRFRNRRNSRFRRAWCETRTGTRRGSMRPERCYSELCQGYLRALRRRDFASESRRAIRSKCLPPDPLRRLALPERVAELQRDYSRSTRTGTLPVRTKCSGASAAMCMNKLAPPCSFAQAASRARRRRTGL